MCGAHSSFPSIRPPIPLPPRPRLRSLKDVHTTHVYTLQPFAKVGQWVCKISPRRTRTGCRRVDHRSALAVRWFGAMSAASVDPLASVGCCARVIFGSYAFEWAPGALAFCSPGQCRKLGLLVC
jgi:hypothetical protein